MRLALIAAAGIAVCAIVSGAIFYGADIKGFLHSSAAILAKTVDDTLHPAGSMKVIAEIPLDRATSAARSALPGISSRAAALIVGNLSTPKVSQQKQTKASSQSGAAGGAQSVNTPSFGALATGGSAPPVSNAPSAPVSVSTAQSDAAAVAHCDFNRAQEPNHKALINEIAWMGSPARSGESTAQAADREWIELKNNLGAAVSMANWQLTDSAGKLRIVFGQSDRISVGGFFLLERGNDDAAPGVAAGKIYTGALSNDGMTLKLFDGACNLVDEISASGGWPGGDNGTKQTLERTAANFSWHTSVFAGGTPAALNSIAGSLASPPRAAAPVPRHEVRVARSGSGAGSVLSSPSGISCGDECGASFNKGTPVILIATPDEDSSFSGWSGACSGSGSCAFTVLGDITATASFIPREVSGGVVQPSATSSAQATSTQVAGQETAAGQRGHVVITEIMAGREGSADYEFVELYNAGDAAVDLTGWSVKKKSSTGSESSLVVASRLEGKTILPRRHFLLVNDGGYDGAVPADVRWATSNTLAYTNNAVALYDGDGAKVEEIAWAEIPKGSSYERQMATGQFFIQSAPNPENSSSM